MMKKKYQQPKVDITDMELISMIAGTGGPNADEQHNPGMGVRSSEVWSEEDEEY